MYLDKIGALLARRVPGHGLPGGLYNDADVFAFDLAAIHGQAWLLVGFDAELPRPGAYLSLMVGRWPILITRDRGGALAAFHNTCRHRGAQICPPGRGAAARLVCPYHAWTYDLNGALTHAPRMDADFDNTALGLRRVHVESLEGAIHVCLADTPPPFDAFRDRFGPLLARAFPVGVSGHFDYGEDDSLARFNARMADLGLPVGPVEGAWWQAMRFALNDGATSMTLDGRPAVATLMCERGGGDIGSLRWSSEPASFCHATGDHLFMFSAQPLGPKETVVTSKWLVHGDAREGIDYEVAALAELWTRTNLQDRDLCENNQRGVDSPGYEPGPYCAQAEALAIRFDDWYCAAARAWIEAH